MNIDFNNVFFDGFNGVSFSLTGMSIVFVGLIVICIYVFILPKILNFKLKKSDDLASFIVVESVKDDSDETLNITIAIAAALHLEQGSINDNQLITWDRDFNESNWKAVGRANAISTRTQIRGNWRG